MLNRPWRLQDAKTHFSQVVDAALRGEVQHITRRGRAAVVVLSEEDYRRLTRNARVEAPSFVEHLLAMPRDDGGFERSAVALREVDLE